MSAFEQKLPVIARAEPVAPQLDERCAGNVAVIRREKSVPETLQH
jgi:hypothetical protein